MDVLGTSGAHGDFDTSVSQPPVVDRYDADNVEDDTEDEGVQTVRFRISSYGADYTVDSLVKRLNRGDFYIPPFQRQYVWTQAQASRFIESLLLGLPVPNVFVAREAKSSKHLIIDGQQRLKTLQYFFQNYFIDHSRRFQLKDVALEWKEMTVDDLSADDRLRLEDSIVRVTIFKQDHPDDDRSIYSVFERLNTGATKLYPQEIRNCVSHGTFIDLLKELNRNQSWRSIFGAPSKRQKDQELILRFLAFYFEGENYTRPMRNFLDNFTINHSNISDPLASEVRDVFVNTIQTIFHAIGQRAFRPKFRILNAAVFDSVMVAVAKRLGSGPISNFGQLKNAYEKLLTDDGFVSGFQGSTADVGNVRSRFTAAHSAFQKIA